VRVYGTSVVRRLSRAQAELRLITWQTPAVDEIPAPEGKAQAAKPKQHGNRCRGGVR
jgi:hypothetical protein